MKPLSSNFFWLLHQDLSKDKIQVYRNALSKFSSTALEQSIDLLESKVPLWPRAYVLPTFLELSFQTVDPTVLSELSNLIDRFEDLTQTHLGGKEKPLLLTVRGGYCGVIRNIGVSALTLPSLAHSYGSLFAFSLYVDFLESYSTLVLGASYVDFRKTFGIKVGRDSNTDDLAKETEESFLKKVRDYQNLISQKIRRPFPEKPEQQLLSTLTRFGKLTKTRGKDEIFIQTQFYQSQFGQSIRGVAYTRHPFSGSRDAYGVFQWGEEGKKAPLNVVNAHVADEQASATCLRTKYPAIYSEIMRHLPKIEASYRDVMEVEFITDEDGQLSFSQFEKAETTARAGVVSTIELNKEGIITDSEAILRLKPKDIEALLHPTLDDDSRANLKSFQSSGVTAAPGTAVGHVFFKMRDAMEFHQKAKNKKTDARLILITDELSISDTPGLGLIGGLVTKASGIASHAAVMARANGIPCIVGYQGLEIDTKANACRIHGKLLKEGTLVTLEAGIEGHLFLGEGLLHNLSFKEGVIRDLSMLLSRVLKQEKVPLQIRVNINNPKDAEVGLSFGASGVGLCRTENMFMEPEALREVRNIIFTQNVEKCKQSFKILEERQFSDFKKIFEVMQDRVVNIRLMDLPLHDFVPQTPEDFNALASQLSHLEKSHIRVVAEGLREHNPMLGLRACRFGLITPELYDLQIRAIIKAAYKVSTEKVNLNPGIMFPLVLFESELAELKARVLKIEEQVREKLKIPEMERIQFRVGSMIELPGAALGADRLAKIGEFFAFGTNDLTQTTLGMSRDDSAHYLPSYLEKGFLGEDPFKVLSEPVKELIEMAVRRGKRVRPDASFGICGEQGGNIATLRFCLEKGLDYISCSPFRVLPAQLSLARVFLTAHSLGERNEFRTPSISSKDGTDPSLKILRAG